jgi:hypothetical protein
MAQKLFTAAILLSLVGCGGEPSSPFNGPPVVSSGGSPGTNGGSPGATGGSPGTSGGAGQPGAAGSEPIGTGGGPTSCGADCSVPVGRPTALACPATDVSMWETVDAGASGGAKSCSVDADCGTIGPVGGHCLNGQCGADECFTNSDCPSGKACGCSTDFHYCCTHVNRCVPSNCNVDSDCGENGACSAVIGYCGSLTGFYCHTADDQCHTDADCNDKSTPTCSYNSALGHWACEAPTTCAG